MASPIKPISADAAILISEISRKNKGDQITWVWMSSLVSREINGSSSVMQTVHRNLLNNHDMVLKSITGIGYIVCDDVMVTTDIMSGDRHRRRRSAKRSMRRAQSVELDNLTEIQQLQCFGEIASAQVVISASTPASQKKMISQLGGETKPLALNKALMALIGNGIK